MGERGPVPKRSDQRRRVNKPPAAIKTTPPAAAGPAAAGWSPPAMSVREWRKRLKGWHPIARQWFEGLASSAQAGWFQPSDWSMAVVLAESMSRELQPQPIVDESGVIVDVVERPPRAASMGAWWKAMSSLLVSEGDRRRMLIELAKTNTSDGDDEGLGVSDVVSRLDAYRARLDGTG